MKSKRNFVIRKFKGSSSRFLAFFFTAKYNCTSAGYRNALEINKKCL